MRIMKGLAALAVIGCTATPVWGATVTVTASDADVDIGDAVTITVEVSGLGDGAAPSLGAFDLDLEFDGAVFAYTSATIEDGLGDAGAGEATTAVTPGTGSVRLQAVSLLPIVDLDSNQPGTFTLATLQFDATAGGTGDFDLSVTALGDAAGAALPVDGITPDSVTVNAPAAPGAPGGATTPIPTLSPAGLLVMLLLMGWMAVRTGRNGS